MLKVIIVFMVATTALFGCSGNESQVVTVSGRSICIDEVHFFIKGVCYKPVPIGSDVTSFANLDEDLKLMNEAGINTIRVYSPIDDPSVLDKIHAAGIKVIIDFGYNQDGFYDILSGSYIDYVKKYMHHEAILFWELGNEFNYHPEWFEGDIQNWYKALNNAAIQIHNIDSLHPIATAHGELPLASVLDYCSAIDVWGMNVYRWDNPEAIFNEWTAISEKPMYLSEVGADSYMTKKAHGYDKGNNELAQADATSAILEDVFRNVDVCSGVAIFAFTDEWWKAGNNLAQDTGGFAPNSAAVPYDGVANEEYWGIVDINRNKKLVFEVIQKQYTNVK